MPVKPILALALAAGNAILASAMADTFRSSSHGHPVPPHALLAYAAGIVVSVILWTAMIRHKPAPKVTHRPGGGSPFGGPR